MKKPVAIDPRVHQLKAVNRLIAAQEARDHLLPFMLLTMPDPVDVEDAKLSRYEITPQARLLTEIMEKVEKGTLKRVCVSIGPQLGKSQILSRGAPAWIAGRNPYRNMILGSYNQDFANEFGFEVRNIISAPAYKQVFPAFELMKGGTAKDLLVSKEGGKLAFVGVGGSGTGKPADLCVVDDPFRNDEDANSATYREKVWKWFNSTIVSRATDATAIVVVHCLVGDTEVSMADGTSKPIRYVRQGDRVATYECGAISAAKVLNWANQGPDKVFEVKMQSGVVVRANGRHPFLIVSDEGESWRRTDMLKKGDVIRRVITANGKVSPAANAISLRNAEASARPTTTSSSGRLGIYRRPREILRTAATRICETVTGWISRGTSVCWPNKVGFARYASSFRQKSTFLCSGKGGCASTIATTAGPFEVCCATPATSQLGTQERKLFCSRPPCTFEVTADTIADITDGGMEDVFDIQIDRTENFIANSLVSHNTRWHQDDLIGRLCDPSHPERDGLYKGIAKRWEYINIPAVVEDEALAKALGLNLQRSTDPNILEQFGSAPISALWPGRKSLPLLAEAKQSDPRTFNALYMGRPAPEQGEYFKNDYILEYDRKDLPKRLRMYGASDHAVSKKQRRDYTCLGCIGIDENDEIWVMPDIVWRRMETDKTVEELLGQFKIHKPALWWLENEMISKSFGPFLRKRMIEDKIYTTLDPITPASDLETRGRSIQGRMAMQMVHFPKFAPWWQNARTQILTFPYATNDDFVSWLALIGLGLTKELKPSTGKQKKESEPATGSIQWILQRADETMRKTKRDSATAGW